MKSLTKLIITSSIAVFVLAITLSAALGVSEGGEEKCITACYNNLGHPYCSPNDETCEYVHSDCTIEADSDGDGWTDTCDAFPTDEHEWVDLDGDESGHNDDCNDLDPNIRPEATEICGNGIDEDCDGSDMECPVCTDNDGDGFGDDCEAGPDCNDDESTTNPGASEICNDNIDNDCDGLVDEGCNSKSSSSSHSKRHGASGSSSGEWDRCESKWDCVSDCEAGTISCTDLNHCELALNKPTEPQCPAKIPPVTKETNNSNGNNDTGNTTGNESQTSKTPEYGKDLGDETNEETKKDKPVAIVGNAVRDTGRGGNLWPLLGVLLIFVPWKKCDKCQTRNMITRSQCKKCNHTFYKIKKNSFLYKVRHLPFL